VVFSRLASDDAVVVNPWLHESPAEESVDEADTPDPAPAAADPRRGGVAPLDRDRQLPRRVREDLPAGQLVALGVHGGAGEQTVTSLLAQAARAGHAWPLPARGAHPFVVLAVARTNRSGLAALRDALRDWTAARLPVHLAAVVLLADAPGRLPRDLRPLLEAISVTSPVPPLQIGWQPAWRVRRPLMTDAPAAQLLGAVRDLPITERITCD
jgi:hypothetical protein